jgi:hypothetical protein
MLFRSLPRCYVLQVEVAHHSFSRKSCIVCHMTAHMLADWGAMEVYGDHTMWTNNLPNHVIGSAIQPYLNGRG